MNKIMAVAALGIAMLVGCNGMKKDDDMSSDPKKMSVEGKTGCSASSCDKSKAK